MPVEIHPPICRFSEICPLDSYLCYLHVPAEIPHPPVCRFSEICHWTVTYMCLQKFYPWFADFLNSATGQLPKLPTCACRNSPSPSLQIFQNLPLDSYLSYLHVLAEPPPVCRFSEICPWTVTYMCLQKFYPWFADFLNSATGQLPKLPTCACRNSPSPVCRFFKNLPLDSYLSYLHVLAEPPPVCRFSEICHWTVTYMCLQKFTLVCRFSEFCHWTVT